MPSIFLSPHNDDEALFCAYTLMREKPVVLMITDAHIQHNRGEKGCDAETRWQESKNACDILGCPLIRVGIKDYELHPANLATFLRSTISGFDKIYVPALQGGNPHHDMVYVAAKEIFPDKIVCYATYAKGEFYTKGKIENGDTEVVPTKEERELKNRALLCYVSQLALPATRPHFDAVKNEKEWLIKQL